MRHRKGVLWTNVQEKHNIYFDVIFYVASYSQNSRNLSGLFLSAFLKFRKTFLKAPYYLLIFSYIFLNIFSFWWISSKLFFSSDLHSSSNVFYSTLIYPLRLVICKASCFWVWRFCWIELFSVEVFAIVVTQHCGEREVLYIHWMNFDSFWKQFSVKLAIK